MSVRETWDMECPACHEDDALDVAAVIFVELKPDGTEDNGGDHEWDHESACKCRACGWSGLVKDATLRRHYFDSTGDAYDAVQCRGDIEDGDTLVIESEQVVGIAHTWPVAVTVTSGNLHEVADPSFITDTWAKEAVDAAIREVQRRGWPLGEHFTCLP